MGATGATALGAVTDTTITTSEGMAVVATNATYARPLFLIGDPPEPPDPYDEDGDDEVGDDEDAEEDEPTVRPFRTPTPIDRAAAAAVLRVFADEVEAAV